MGMNSYMLLDSRHDTIIQKAYSYYCISRQLQFCRTAELTADEIRYYILIYDAKFSKVPSMIPEIVNI